MMNTSPRFRTEAEPARLLRTRRPVPIATLTTSFATILTARADADFLFDQLCVASIGAGTHHYSVCLVPPAGTAAAGNAVAWEIDLTAKTTDVVIGGQGLIVPPGYTLQAAAQTNTRINIFGWGYDMIGGAGE